jgi:hypothetical protein
VEAAQVPSIAVSTLDSKPGASPFTSDAWAAAMAAGVQEKLTQRDAKTLAPDVPEVEASVPVEERSPFTAPTYTPASPEILPAASTQLLQEEKAAEPGNWSAVPEASWEAQAKRAAMLASTWDVATTRSPEETQDVPTYTSEQSSAERTTLESPDNAPSAYSGHWEHEHEPSPSSATPKHEEIHEPARESTLPKSWENAGQTPPSVNASAPIQPNVAHETPAEPAPEVQRIFETPAAQEYVHEPMSAPIVEPEPAPEPAATAAAPNMDELVARVLGKMNPEVLQKVTREILKPVIEAIVRDELESKK